MKIYHESDISIIKENVSCIGYFDGVHLGHQELMKKTITEAKKNHLCNNVITFYPDPEKVIKNKDVLEITSLKRRLELFESLGIENVLLLDFDEKMMKKSPEEFIRDYIISSHVKTLVTGFDFHFGYMGKGNTETLMKIPDFKTIVVPEIKMDDEKISSTRIRMLIKKGDIKKARELLGHD